ncbi:MAG: FCD domain-containing protein [Deltaproteobacteria bacterium]|nr:FCD domain-containing protein [Deltaproteobacteria bacterium]
MDQQIKRTSAADEVFANLYTRITNLEIKVGDRLPTQEELSARFSVSRNTIREAITRLNVMGLVTTRQGSGTVVTRPASESLVDIGGKNLLMEPAAVTEFLEARLFVERANVRLAVMRATPLELDRLRSLTDAQHAAVEKDDMATYSKLDVEFHMTIAAYGCNRVMNAFFNTIWEKLHQFVTETSRLEGISAVSVQAHKKMVEHMVARDAVGAEYSLTEHLYRTGQGIERNTGTKLGLEAFVDLLHVPMTQQRL